MILITLPNVTGDCEIPNFSGYFTAESFSFSASREITESAKAGTRDVHIGMAEMQEVSLGKSMDKASVPLMKWAIAGTQIPGEVLIRFVETGANSSGDALHINFMNVKLDRTFVKSWSLSGDADSRPTEELTLYFQYFAIAYVPFKGTDIDTSKKASVGWDHAKNAPWGGKASIEALLKAEKAAS